MQLSREAKLLSGVSILAITTVMYGGATLLGILTHGLAGLSAGGLTLDSTQWALFRAGHAHAGVWVILSVVIQMLLDSARLSSGMRWLARITAPLAAIVFSGGFFGLAFVESFRWLVYFGALCLIVSLLLTGFGLLRNLRQTDQPI